MEMWGLRAKCFYQVLVDILTLYPDPESQNVTDPDPKHWSYKYTPLVFIYVLLTFLFLGWNFLINCNLLLYSSKDRVDYS